MRRFLARVVTHRWLITACLAAGILVLSLIPDPPKLGVEVHYGDKIGHFAAYFVFGFMLLLCLDATRIRARASGAWAPRASRLKIAAVAVAAAVCYGALIEVLQHFTGRQTELWDLVADLAGALSGALVFLLVFQRRVVSPRRPDR